MSGPVTWALGARSRGGEYGSTRRRTLRAIRRQKGLSLHDVEARSNLEFKASVLGAYERGERAISVPRLLRLSEIYEVPCDQLLPRELDGAEISLVDPATSAPGRPQRRLHDRPRAPARPRRPGCAGPVAVRDDDPARAPGLQRPAAHDPPRRPAGARRGAWAARSTSSAPGSSSSGLRRRHRTPAAHRQHLNGATAGAPAPTHGAALRLRRSRGGTLARLGVSSHVLAHQDPGPGQPPDGRPARPARRAVAPRRGRVPGVDPRARQRDHDHRRRAGDRTRRAPVRGARRAARTGPRDRPRRPRPVDRRC